MQHLNIGVLALQGAVSEHATILRDLGANVSLVKKPADLTGLQGLVIPGGESTAIARLAAPTRLLPAVRARIDSGSLAVFGTCAGLILLANEIVPPDSALRQDALADFDRVGGLDIVVSRNAYGNHLDSFEAFVELYPQRVPELESPYTDLAFAKESAPHLIPAAFIRAPKIEKVGPLARVIAVHGSTVVTVTQGNVIGASFHPEITHNDLLHRSFVELALGIAQ